jgi:hypothetical protein
MVLLEVMVVIMAVQVLVLLHLMELEELVHHQEQAGLHLVMVQVVEVEVITLVKVAALMVL